jgi:hypothetical protein
VDKNEETHAPRARDAHRQASQVFERAFASEGNVLRGPNRSHLYESTQALPAIYAGARSLEEARIKQAEAAARLNEIRAEELAKKRIPIEIVIETLDQTMQAMSATLKASKDKVLTMELINNIFADFRAIPAKLNW